MVTTKRGTAHVWERCRNLLFVWFLITHMQVNIYPLMCELLGLNQVPNNGSRANYEDILSDGSHASSIQHMGYAVLMCISTALIIFNR